MVARSTTSGHNKKERDRRIDERRGTRTREFRGTEVVRSYYGRPRCSPDSQFKRSTNTKLLYLRSFVRFVSPGEAIFLLSFLDMPRFSVPSLSCYIPPRLVDLGVAFKAMEKTNEPTFLRSSKHDLELSVSFFYFISLDLVFCNVAIFGMLFVFFYKKFLMNFSHIS